MTTSGRTRSSSSTSRAPLASSTAVSSWPRGATWQYGARKCRSDRNSSTRTRGSRGAPSVASSGVEASDDEDPKHGELHRRSSARTAVAGGAESKASRAGVTSAVGG
eukprot:scaffold12352_cov129-Isochrysis_galbana.AAC.4